MKIEPGVYNSSELSNEAYHSDTESLSRTAIMEFRKSPFNYWAKYLNPDRPKKETKESWEIGKAFHVLMLEPELFESTYVIEPEKVLLKDVGREKYDEYKNIIAEIELSGKKSISPDDFARLNAMRSSIINHPEAFQLINDAIYEQSYVWKDEHSGLMVKCRPDILHDNMIVDLKTCSDASPRSFQREMVLYGYHIQGAMVREGIKQLAGKDIQTVINVVVETSYPHNTAIYIIDEYALEIGHQQFKQALLDIKSAKEYNIYESYATQTISLPRWAIE